MKSLFGMPFVMCSILGLVMLTGCGGSITCEPSKATKSSCCKDEASARGCSCKSDLCDCVSGECKCTNDKSCVDNCTCVNVKK